MPRGLLKIQTCQSSHVTMTAPISHISLFSWQLWREQTVKIWILSKISVAVFIATCGKMTSRTLFESFCKQLLHGVTSRQSFLNFKMMTRNAAHLNNRLKSRLDKLYMLAFANKNSQMLMFNRINSVVIWGFPHFVFWNKNLWTLFVLHNK